MSTFAMKSRSLIILLVKNHNFANQYSNKALIVITFVIVQSASDEKVPRHSTIFEELSMIA